MKKNFFIIVFFVLLTFTNKSYSYSSDPKQFITEIVNEAKKILAFEVTKITRGIKSAKEAEDIANNIFNKKTLDERIPTYEVSSLDIEKSNFLNLQHIHYSLSNL